MRMFVLWTGLGDALFCTCVASSKNTLGRDKDLGANEGFG